VVVEMNQPKELDRDRPVFEAGEVVTSEDGAFAFSIIEFIGEGRSENEFCT